MKHTTHLPQPIAWVVNATAMTQTTTPIRRKSAPEHQPTVYYTTDAWTTITYIVHACKDEVGWLGLVDTLESGDYLVTDIYVPQQEVSGATTEIEADAMSDLAMEILEAGKDPSKLFYWGHSHVNMAVSPSGQDERQLGEYIEHCPVFIRGIYNKKGDAKVDVFDRDAEIVHQCVDNYPLHDLIEPELKASLDALLKANVKTRVYKSFNTIHGTTPTVTTKNRQPGFTPSTKHYEFDDDAGAGYWINSDDSEAYMMDWTHGAKPHATR